MKYPQLASPLQIGSITLRNRTVMTAMGVAMAQADGIATDRIIAFYKTCAAGGVGLLIPEFTRVSELGPGTLYQLSLSDDRHIAPWKRLVDAVHSGGAKIFAQLHHAGRQTYSALIGGAPVLAPSAIPCGRCGQETRALTLEEIPQIVDQFISAAIRAKAAGADGVEVHCTHGYLLQQFLSPYANHRTDAYGGTPENRARIACEIIRGIKAACGQDYPISVRLTAEEYLSHIGKPNEGIHLPDALIFSKLFEDAGADLLNISSGCYETSETFIEPTTYEEGWRIHWAAEIKKAVSIPVFGNSVIRNPAYAEGLLERGVVDLIGMGRTFLADPEWPNKVFAGQESRLRRCISCLRCAETFTASSSTGKPLECSVNARLGKELEYPWPPAKDGERRRVVILGSGPAGLECARVLAERNFAPIVFEREDKIGGQLRSAQTPPSKDKIGWLIDYYRNEFERLGVDVRCGKAPTIEEIAALKPYAVVVATGSKPLIPRSIPGVHLPHVCTAEDILLRGLRPTSKQVCVIGSGMTGLECADLLSEAGNGLTVVEMADTVAPGAFASNVKSVMHALQSKNVCILTSHKLVEITPKELVLEQADGTRIRRPADMVVLSLGVSSENSLLPQLTPHFENVHAVGDSANVGRIANAVADGFCFAYALSV